MFRKCVKTAVPVGGSPPTEQTANLLSVTSLARATRVSNEAAIRELCHSVYLGEDTALCRVLGRYKMYVDSRDTGIAPHLMLDGYWEMWVTEVLISMVRAGTTVADIGANLGYFSLLLADLVGPGGRVHSFEPNPRMIDLLHRSVAVNGFSGRVQIHQTALGSAEGEVVLVVPPGDPKNAHIVPSGNDMPENAITVPVARLDSRPDWTAIEFAKIDVEGAEQLIWAGAQGLLDNGNLKAVVLEFAAARYLDPERFLKTLLAPGFGLAYVHLSDGVLETTPRQILECDPHIDIMLVLRR